MNKNHSFKTNLKEPFLNRQTDTYLEIPNGKANTEIFGSQQKVPIQAAEINNLNSYFKSISFESDLSEFYEVKDVFQRNEYCHVIGLILEITSSEIQELITDSLMLNKQRNHSQLITQLFQIWIIKNGAGQKIYQKGLTSKQCISQCSIHESYATFVISKATPLHHYHAKDDLNIHINYEGEIHVVALDTKEELTFDNMMEGPISAIFIDEQYLVIGSGNHIHYMPLKQLFAEGGVLSPTQDKKHDYQIPDDVSIYAFWRGKFEKHYEVYTTNLNNAGLKIYNFETLGMQAANLHSNNQRLRKMKSIANSIDSGRSNESGLNLIKKIDLGSLKESHMMRSDRRLKIETQGWIQDLNMLASPMTVNKTSSFRVHDKDDNFTNRVIPEVIIFDEEKADHDRMSAQAVNDLKLFSSDEDATDTQGQQNDFFGDKNHLSLLPKSKFKQPTSVNKIIIQSVEIEDGDKYVKTKFYWRQTLAFRKNGQVDFISSDGNVYSTKNLDFLSSKNQQKLDSTVDDTILTNEQPHQLKVIDAFVNGSNIYIVDEKNYVHCLNIDTLICSKTDFTPQEAHILPYQDSLKLFSNFLIYDNQIIVSHGPILSVYDLNADINDEPAWRHLYTKEKTHDQTQSYQDSLLTTIQIIKKPTQQNSFEQCKSDIRIFKMREQENEVEPRLIVLYNNNRIAVGIRNLKLQWEFEQNQEWNIDGIITNIIQSVKTTSLILFLHKDNEDQKQNQLLLFYCTDKSNIQRMKIMEGIEEDERVFAISISESYMKDLTQFKPKIGIYNDTQRSIRIMQLEEEEENSEQYYGTMRQIHKIERVKLHQKDIIRESGNERFVFLGRENKIYKLYLHEQVLTETMEEFSEINSESNKSGLKHEIQSFDIFEKDQFVYASTQTQLFFNHQSPIYSQESMLQKSLTKTNYDIYFDDKYQRICTFSGPFTLVVFPYLHINRISLMGIHHEASPIFYQHKGEAVHVLTSDSKIKTWSLITGKLISSTQLTQRYDNYKKMNERQGKTLIYKQDKNDFYYHYLLLEIVDADNIIEHALILSEHKSDIYINNHKNLLFRKDVTQKKRNCYEICSFNHITGDIIETVKTIDQYSPINFLSPSFALYIFVDTNHCNIVVKETFTEKTIYTFPKTLRKSITSKHHNLTIEDIEDQIYFLEEDLLLIETQQNFEIVYSIRNEKEILLFNKLKPHYKFNNYLLPDSTERIYSTHKAIKNIFQGQVVLNNDFMDSDKSVNDEGDNQWWDNQLKDLMFLNLKYYRERKFINHQSTGLLAWGSNDQIDQEDHQGSHLKLYTVLPFSYLIWKLIDDVSYKKGQHIKDIEPGVLFMMAFAIIPYKKETLMHKLVKNNTQGLMYMLDLSKKANLPQLDQPLPHLQDFLGKTPLHLAFQLNIRRQVDVLITHIKDYPLDYCTAEITELLPGLIQNNYINRVGDYLDARMLVPEWTSHYKREQLIIKKETNGQNYASTTYWPSTSKNFENVFFSSAANDVPVKIELLDVPNIHLYNDPISEEFLNSLVRSGDIEIFDRKPIKAIISYKWDEARRVMMWKLFLPYMIYLAFFNFFLEYVFDKEQALQLFGDQGKVQLAERISKCILILFAAYFLIHEFKQIKRAAKGTGLYIAFSEGGIIWSFVDGVPLLCSMLSMVLDTFVGESAESIRIQRPFYAISTLLLWLKVFYFLRLFRNLGHLVRMVFFVIYSIRYYFFICFCFTLALANCFYVLSQNNTPENRFIDNYLDSIKFTFYMYMLKFEPSMLGEVDLFLVWALIISSLILQGFILFNLNVAMMKNFYDICDRKSEQNTYRVFAMMIIESYDLVHASTNQELLHDSYQNNHQTQIDSKTTLCSYGRNNQCLLIAQPDSEEFKPKLDENTVKLSEIKEMIQKTTNIINKREDEIMQRIDQEVFNKMAEMDEKQSHSFQLLERSQLQMMKMIEQLVIDKHRQ